MKNSPSKRGSRVARARSHTRRSSEESGTAESMARFYADRSRRLAVFGYRCSEPEMQKSAVDRDAFAGHVTRRRQAEERDGRGDFLGLADATHRRALQDFVEIIGIG